MFFRRLHWALAIVLLTALAVMAQAQKSAAVWTDWETLSPDNEEFSVLMPKSLTKESTTFPYHKMELNARLYLASSSAGPILAVTSLSGIKSDPAQYTEFARFNSYIDAFKDFFPAKVRSKETPIKLTLLSSRPFRGYTGRSFRMTLGDLNGSVNAFVTRKRFYAIVSLNTKKDEALEEKFLASFEIPERQMEPAENTAANADPKAKNNAAEANDQNPNVQAETELNPAAPNQTGANTNAESAPANAQLNNQPQNPAQNPGTPTGQPGQRKGPISGGALNGKAIYMPLPELPPGEASGVVLVAVVVDEQGGVVEARAISGPQPLHQAAVNAARLARFAPTLLMGEAVRVSGTLSYSFGRSN